MEKVLLRPCIRCRASTPTQVHVTNHALHFILSLLTLGLWIFIWIIAIAANGTANAQVKGEECQACRADRLRDDAIAARMRSGLA